MAYAIEQQFIAQNRSGQKLIPLGLIIHSTANPGATAQGNRDYFNSGDRGASAHGFSDWLKKAIQTIPFNEQAWHAFQYANTHFLGWEICEGTTIAQFQDSWELSVWVAATLCLHFKWDPAVDMHSHKWVSDNYQGDHQDPIPYFTKWGKSWNDFVSAVKVELASLQPPIQSVDLVRVVNATGGLNVRSNPDASSTIRYTVPNGQPLHLSQLQGDWAFTTYGALGGWVSRQYLTEPPKPVTPSPAPTPVPTRTSPQAQNMPVTPSAPVIAPAPTPSTQDLVQALAGHLAEADKIVEQLKGAK